jgi:hypothetical protein
MDAAIMVGIGWCRWLEGVSGRVSLVLVQRMECGGLVEEDGNSDSLIME